MAIPAHAGLARRAPPGAGRAPPAVSRSAQVRHVRCRTGVVKRLEERWQRRWQEARPGPVRTFRIQEPIKLRQPPAVVWALIAPAEHAVLLAPETVARSFRVPGTPGGLGEQQCFVDLEGNTSIHEVIEYSDARRAVTRMISPPSSIPLRATNSLEPLGDGCIFTVGMEFDAPAGTNWPQAQQDEWRRGALRYLARVRQTLAAEEGQ